MRFYRVYGLDRADCIDAIHLISATDDFEALRQARTETGFHAVEVWDQSRLVGRIGAPEALFANAEIGSREVVPGLPAALSGSL